jgi:hypothetical protein
MNPTVDTKKLGETQTFFNAEVLDSEDTDGVNTDLIDKLKKQEEEYNKTINDLKAPFEKEQADQQIKNNEALEALKTKIASVDADTFKKLDEGMSVNKQNRVERQKQDAEREIAERTKEDKDGALASLRNYESCATKPVKETPERVFQDVNLQDVIAQSGRQLLGGKKKNSVANQVYLLNKRYVDSNGFESPLVRTNSARKKGGATNMSNEQDTTSALGIQSDTTDYLNTSRVLAARGLDYAARPWPETALAEPTRLRLCHRPTGWSGWQRQAFAGPWAQIASRPRPSRPGPRHRRAIVPWCRSLRDAQHGRSE